MHPMHLRHPALMLRNLMTARKVKAQIRWFHRCRYHGTGWQRPIGCLTSCITFRQLATNYRALLRKMTYENKASYEALPPCRTNEDIYEYYLWSTVIKCASFLWVCYTLLITSPSPPAFCKYLKRFEFNTTAISRFEGYWGFGHVRAFICDGNDLRNATSVESPREFVPANDTTLMRFQALNATHMVQLSCDVAQLISESRIIAQLI